MGRERYEEYVKASKKSKFHQLSEELRTKFVEMDLLGTFIECEIAERKRNEDFEDFTAIRNDIKFSVSCTVMMRFTTAIISRLTQMVQEDELKPFYKILMYFLPNSFPLS